MPIRFHRHVRKDSNLVFSGTKYTSQLTKTIQPRNYSGSVFPLIS